MKVIHFFTQEKNFDRNYLPWDVSETFLPEKMPGILQNA
jgi:hypothetical protein